MDFTKMVFGGALIGTLVSAWNTIKSIAWKFCNIVLKRVTITKDLHNDVLNYLRENYKFYYLHDRNFHSGSHYIKTDNRYQMTGWEDFSNCSFLFLKGKIPFLYSSKSNISTNPNGTKNEDCKITIYYIRGTLDFEKIIKDSVLRRNRISEKYANTKSNISNRFFIKYIPENKVISGSTQQSYDFTSVSNKLISHNLEDIGFTVRNNGIEKLILSKENKEIINLAELWHKNKHWYESKDIPWKMGWLLHGPPGTGKTLLSRKIAEYLGIPIFIYKLGLIGDSEFSEKWVDMQQSVPCVALIEDFDNVFHGRENVSTKDMYMNMFPLNNNNNIPVDPGEKKERYRNNKLSFDNLLNTLDGAERYEGVLTIITTNHIDKIDSALLDRPGRVDRIIELTYLTEYNKIIMIDNILSDMPNARNTALQYIDTHKDKPITPAQLQEKCTEFVLKEFYRQSLEKSKEI